MIKTQNLTINGKEYIKTWSDAGKLIERDGAKYEDAIDPAELGRVYTETDEPIPDRELSDSEALAMLTGGEFGDA